ncbi:MAG: FecR family protein [Myxococcota bacterium]
MKFYVVTILAAFLLITGASPALAAPETLGRIQRSRGTVKRTDVEKVKAGVASGDPVYRGTRFTTGSDGNVEIKLTNGSLMRIRSNSSLQLSPTKRRRKKKNSVVLFFGRVWSSISKAAGADENYEVATPTAVAGVRGTEFETAVAPDGSVRVRVDEGRVAVADGGVSRDVKRGQRVDGDVGGLGKTGKAGKKPQWDSWQEDRTERVKKEGPEVMRQMKGRIEARRQRLETLESRRKELEAQLSKWERQGRLGDPRAAPKIAEINEELSEVLDEIADISDATRSQFGYVGYLAELADDPRFGMIGAEDLKREAATLIKLKRQFDAFESIGKDMSIKGMDQILDDARGGKRDTLREEKGSVKDLFGD